MAVPSSSVKPSARQVDDESTDPDRLPFDRGEGDQVGIRDAGRGRIARLAMAVRTTAVGAGRGRPAASGPGARPPAPADSAPALDPDVARGPRQERGPLVRRVRIGGTDDARDRHGRALREIVRGQSDTRLARRPRSAAHRRRSPHAPGHRACACPRCARGSGPAARCAPWSAPRGPRAVPGPRRCRAARGRSPAGAARRTPCPSGRRPRPGRPGPGRRCRPGAGSRPPRMRPGRRSVGRSSRAACGPRSRPPGCARRRSSGSPRRWTGPVWTTRADAVGSRRRRSDRSSATGWSSVRPSGRRSGRCRPDRAATPGSHPGRPCGWRAGRRRR